MATQQPRDACPECGALVQSPTRSTGPGTFGNEVPELTREFSTCEACGAKLERPLHGGPHPWQLAAPSL
jgi:uncharacterized protein with PIN domain